MSSAATEQFKVIGTRPVRHDGIDKVTGRAKYGADYSFPNMLHGKVLRSPFAHARIKSINIERRWRCRASRRSSPARSCPNCPIARKRSAR